LLAAAAVSVSVLLFSESWVPFYGDPFAGAGMVGDVIVNVLAYGNDLLGQFIKTAFDAIEAVIDLAELELHQPQEASESHAKQCC